MKTPIMIVLGLIIISCNNEKKKVSVQGISPATSYFEDFNNPDKILDLTRQVRIEGDTVAYKNLRNIYFLSGHVDDFLCNALIMANDFDFSNAYLDVYTILHTDIIDKTNIKTNKIANYYLILSFEKGLYDSKSVIQERFGENAKIPNSKDYWLEINK